jgi:hypothetical protein
MIPTKKVGKGKTPVQTIALAPLASELDPFEYRWPELCMYI